MPPLIFCALRRHGLRYQYILYIYYYIQYEQFVNICFEKKCRIRWISSVSAYAHKQTHDASHLSFALLAISYPANVPMQACRIRWISSVSAYARKKSGILFPLKQVSF